MLAKVLSQPAQLFRECSVYRELVSTPEMAPRILEMAMRALNDAESVTILGGAGVAGSHDALIGLGRNIERADRARAAR
jgi:thiamine pyrophosphate-dependent acetolactate synthase large subunit-like protein